MSRPIKICDELYERLKDQAEAQGVTLQDALVELIAKPHEGLAKLEKDLRKQEASASTAATARGAVTRELEKIGSAVAQLSARVDQLFQLRGKDNDVWNDWVEVWNQITPLQSRVGSLEKLSHRHVWQEVEEE